VAVVIPTVGRWDILRRTLAGLEAQTETGFEVIVVSDGAGPPPGELADSRNVRFITQKAAGPGAARNRGVGATERSVVLFLGDDMVPDAGLVGAHLASHSRHTDAEVAVLGRVEWHPEVAGNRLNRWLDTSATQFDYAGIEREKAEVGEEDYEVGFARFYSCNVSLKRTLFDSAEGFDESFIFYYEDLELGWRLSDRGMRLLYQPQALTHHLHAYDWTGLENRFRGIALGERLMGRARPSFEPFFHQRIMAATPSTVLPKPWANWAEHLIGATTSRAEGYIPSNRLGLAAAARHRTDISYHRRLAAPFLQAWSTADEMCELREYLGDDYRPELLLHHKEEVDREGEAACDERTFYRTSQAYLYDLTVFAMSATKQPYLAELIRHVPVGGRILDYGCGIGSDGLLLADMGYRVSFADFDNPSTRYLRWRLERRGLNSPVYDIEADVIPADFDAVCCFDVIEHVPDPQAFLRQLEGLGRVLVINFLERDPGDTHLHHDLDVTALVNRAEQQGLLQYRIHHGRSHLVVYQSGGSTPAWSSKSARWEGQALHSLGRIRNGVEEALHQAVPVVKRLKAFSRGSNPPAK
jgi:GT2 family glycosyltransferase/SAM-dependent methyltransferase